MSSQQHGHKPLSILQEETPYTELLKREGTESVFPTWDLEQEGELAIDVLETPKELIVRSAIAGVRPEAISIHTTNDSITIRGSRQAETTYPFAETHIEECHWGSFSRTVILPCAIHQDDVLATLNHGILTIRLPKADPSSSIEVLSIE